MKTPAKKIARKSTSKKNRNPASKTAAKTVNAASSNSAAGKRTTTTTTKSKTHSKAPAAAKRAAKGGAKMVTKKTEKLAAVDLSQHSPKDLKNLISKIDRHLKSQRSTNIRVAMKRMQAIADDYGMTVEEIVNASKAPAKKTRKLKKAKKRSSVPIKYRDNTTGQTWTGRGQRPVWLREAIAKGAELDDFAV